MLDAKKKNNPTCPHLGLTCIYELFCALPCVPVFAFCIEWTCSLWTGDALTLAPCSYCAHKWFKITPFLLRAYLHPFPYHHLPRVEPSESHKLTLILNCQGGKMGYLNFVKDFVVFSCGISAAVRQWTYKSPDSWILWPAQIESKSYIFHNIPSCPFASIFHSFSAVLFLCHLSPPHISGSLFYLDPLILPSC